MQNVKEDSTSPAEAQWNGLSDADKARFGDELCALGTSFVTPLFAIIDNIEKALRERNAVPHGWKLVPLEPTEDMEVHGFESAPHWAFTPREEWEAYEALSGCRQAAYRARVCYKAMLAAAPQPPTEKGSAA